MQGLPSKDEKKIAQEFKTITESKWEVGSWKTTMSGTYCKSYHIWIVFMSKS